MGTRVRLIAGGVGLFLLLAGGAAYVTGNIRSPVTCEGPPIPAWGDNPYKNGGIQVADLEKAKRYLAFTPAVPRTLGPAVKLFISGNKPDMSAKSLILLYDEAAYGRFWVEESISEVTQSEIDSMTNNPTGCSQESVVTLRGGTRAALSVPNPAAHGSGAVATSIMWLDHGRLISLLGFSASFTKDHAIAVANQF